MSLANNIKTLRKKNRLSQAELGKIMFLSQNAISSWERGLTKPSVDEVSTLADLFEVSVDELLDRI